MKTKKIFFYTATLWSFFLCFGVVFFIASHVSAQGLGETVNSGLNYGTIVGFGTADIRVIIFRVIQVAIGFLGILAIILILYGGFIWMTSGGEPQKIERAKQILVNASIGLFIIIAAFSIVSFIIHAILQGTLPRRGDEGPRRPPRLPNCENCGALGHCIIEDLFPDQGENDVARNTAIFVLFKEQLDPSTLCWDAANNPDPNCTGGFYDNDDHIKISYTNPETGVEVFFASNEIDLRVATDPQFGGRLFTFIPKRYLGDGVRNMRHTIYMGNEIKKASDLNGDGELDGAFDDCALGDHFVWRFNVGTRLDLDPPSVDRNEIFPPPDNLSDLYTPVVAQQSQGSIQLTRNARGYIQGSALPKLVTELGVLSGDQPTDARIMGTYICPTNSFTLRYLEEPVGSGNFRFALGPSQPGVVRSPILAGPPANRLTLGCGLIMEFTDNNFRNQLTSNSGWDFTVVANTPADSLTVNRQTYNFIEGPPVSSNEIETNLGDAHQTKLNIISRINADSSFLGVSAVDPSPADPGNLFISIVAISAGNAGDDIILSQLGGWANVNTMSGGKDATNITDTKHRPDQPKNAVIKITFDEPMFPIPVAGQISVNDTLDDPATPTYDEGNDSVGFLASPANPPFLFVQADVNNDGIFSNDEYVGGKFDISNHFRTAEFRSDRDCDGLRNACGDVIYCLPTRADTFTRYKVTVRAANLQPCGRCSAPDNSECLTDNECIAIAPGLLCETNNANCLDPNYNACVTTGLDPDDFHVCQDPATSLLFPTARGVLSDGVVDSARNSLDGNRTRGAEGPVDEFIENPTTPVPVPAIVNASNNAFGDSYTWYFFISDRLEISSPNIVNIDPHVSQDYVNLFSEPVAIFNRILMSSSLRSGSGYRDGLCTCTDGGGVPDVNMCPDRDDHFCQNSTPNLCVHRRNQDTFCRVSLECEPDQPGGVAGSSCLTKRYVSLLDPFCSTSADVSRCIGWRIENEGQDVGTCSGDTVDVSACGPFDDYSDRTMVQIAHPGNYFQELIQYGVDMGSGIRDIYQNCYLPSSGPGVNFPADPASRCNGSPYCCEGIPSNTPCS